MGKGTPSMGKRTGKKTHIVCRRCGEHSYHMNKKRCSSCHYGKGAKRRIFSWLKK